MDIKNIAITFSSLLEAFLTDYCDVNGITESDLKDNLHVISNTSDLSLSVVNKDDLRDLQLGVIYDVNEHAYRVSGHLLLCRELYSRSDNYLKSLENVIYE